MSNVMRAIILIQEVIDVEDEYRRRAEYENRMARVRAIDQEMNRLAICIANERRIERHNLEEARVVDMECPHCRGSCSAWRVSRSWFRTHTYDICNVCYGTGRIPVEVSRPILRRRD